MPSIKFQGKKFLIRPDGDPKLHSASLAKVLGELNYSSTFADVTFHCNNKVTFKANKLVLAFSSKLLGPIFQTSCDLTSFLPVTYDILCPEFKPQALKKILEILYTGETFINTKDVRLYRNMRSILDELQISMALPDIGLLSRQQSRSDLSPNIKQEQDVELIGLISSDLDDPGLIVVDPNPGLISSDLDDGLTVFDPNQGLIVVDSQEGLTGRDPNPGFASSDPEEEGSMRIEDVYQPFVCNYCDKEFRHSQQVNTF
jgi:hypothetical protein